MALEYQIKARARREIEKAAEWWAENRQAVPGAIRQDIEAALKGRGIFLVLTERQNAAHLISCRYADRSQIQGYFENL